MSDRPEIPPRYAEPRPALRLPALWPLYAVVAVGLLVFCYWWFVQRVEVPAGKVLVLIRKVGEPLPPEAEGQVVLYPALVKKLGEPPDSTRYKGILYEVKPEGRYFYDPFFWERRIVDMVYIGPDEVGVLIRRFGKPLPEGKVVATEPDERGPLAEVLPKGRHNVNPFAYEVKRVKRVRIPEGSVGVQTLYAGREPANPNRYVVEQGERGVQPDVLPPGLYDVNPYVRRIDIIDVRSHTIDFRGNDAIRFPSKDSFEILIEGTVEYAIRPDRAPYVLAAVGGHNEIRSKLIMPFMRSFARIEGSKLEAREFISGQTRRAFQQQVFAGLREQCERQGIEIRSTLIRRIEPPAAIAKPISDRQLAEQRIRQYENEIRLAEAQAKLVEQEELQKQNRAIGEARRQVVSMITEAQQRKAVALLEANKRLEVARLQLEAAREQAAAIVARAEAEAEVILLNYEAQARPLREAVAAFGGGTNYARYIFYQKLAPAVRSVLASTDGPLSEVLRALTVPGPGPDIAPTEAKP